MGYVLDTCCCQRDIASCADAEAQLPRTLFAHITCAQCSLLNQTVQMQYMTPLPQSSGNGWFGCLKMQPCANDPHTTFGYVPIVIAMRCCFTGVCRLDGSGGLYWSLRFQVSGCGFPFECGEPASNDPCGQGLYNCGTICANGTTVGQSYASQSVSCGNCSGNEFDCAAADVSYNPVSLMFKWIFSGGLFANSTWGTCSTNGINDGFFHPCCEGSGFGTGEIDVTVTE